MCTTLVLVNNVGKFLYCAFCHVCEFTVVNLLVKLQFKFVNLGILFNFINSTVISNYNPFLPLFRCGISVLRSISEKYTNLYSFLTHETDLLRDLEPLNFFTQ